MLVARLLAVARGFTAAWLAGTQGVELWREGETLAALAPDEPELDFPNTVYGLGAEDVDRVPALLERYRAHGVRPWFELAPGPGFAAVADALAAGGARQIGFHSVLVRPPGDPPPRPAGVTVRPVGSGEIDRFADVLLRGHEVPAEAMPRAVAGCRHWPSIPGLACYLAERDGDALGAGVLWMERGVGYLANAATPRATRGRGAQTALVATRIADATAASCDVLCVLAAFDSQSARNLQRAGFRMACTLARWRVSP